MSAPRDRSAAVLSLARLFHGDVIAAACRAVEENHALANVQQAAAVPFVLRLRVAAAAGGELDVPRLVARIGESAAATLALDGKRAHDVSWATGVEYDAQDDAVNITVTMDHQ